MGWLAVKEVCSLDGSAGLLARGVVDDDTVACFQEGLDWAVGSGSRELIIDLTSCRLNSAGLAAMMRFQRRSGSRPPATSLVVTGADLWMLRIVGVTSRFRVYSTLDAALQGRPVAEVDVRPHRSADVRSACFSRIQGGTQPFAPARTSHGRRQ